MMLINRPICMKVHITFLLLIFSFQANIFSQALFVGPMLHYNFGAEKNYFSYGIEASLWYQSNHYRRPLYGIDFGYEFNETSKRLYSEIQLMAMFAGISNGIVMEWGKDQTRTF